MTRVAKRFFILAMLAVAWTTACSSTPKNPAPPVPVGGARSDVSALSGNTIEGTFTTTPHGNASITTGRWKMTRKKT